MAIQKKTIFLILITVVIFTLILPMSSNAQLGKLESIGGAVFGPEVSLAEIIGTIINAFLGLVGLLFLILALYGGYLWMTARGQEERIKKAKDTLEAAVIGIIIVLAAYGISYFVVQKILEATTGVTATSS